MSRAVSGRLSIINGGAGSGKTTIIREIISRLGGEDIELCAFAGKAAARLREATSSPAGTIHRMLQYNGEKFLRGSLAWCTVIIDEASMVSSDLMAQIVERTPRRLILVGDEAQLPPVGAGQPFHDLIALRKDLVATLTTCHRASEAIFRAASAIREGNLPLQKDTSPQEHWEMRPFPDPASAHRYVLSLVRAHALDFYPHDLPDGRGRVPDIVLVPRNEGDSASVESLNRDIAEILFPDRPHEDRFVPGDRAICLKNYPDLDIWNGTTGTVHSINQRGDLVFITDEPVTGPDGQPTTEVNVPKDKAKEFALAYALTVHKSQGSQYGNVVFLALARDSYSLLNRPMVYTGVTRAKAACVLAGGISAVKDAIRKNARKRTVMQEIRNLMGDANV